MNKERAGPQLIHISPIISSHAETRQNGNTSSSKKEKIMNHPIIKLITRQRVTAGALALAAFVFIGAPQQAAANTTAETKIVNLASVVYTDASGNNTFNASATATITVNLVPSALTASAPPVAGDGTPGISCLTPVDTESGQTISALYALFANANGGDSYNLSMGVPVETNTSNVTVAYSVRTYTGALEGSANPAARTLGSAIPVGFSGTDTLLFPGDTNLTASFAVDDIVVVTTAAGDRAYLVAAVTNGVASVATVGTTIAGSKTNDTNATLQLKAYPVQTILGNSVGGTVAPDFDSNAPTIGVPVGEMVLVQVDVTASNDTFAADGTVAFTLTTNTAPATDVAAITCTVGTWKGVNLAITKEVRLLPAGTFGPTASGNPGDILEYRLTIDNSGGLAKAVVVTDNIPEYTTLVSFSDSYAGTSVLSPAAISTLFAQTFDGTTTTSLTTVNSDDEGDTSGDATGNAAGSTMTFYIGTDSDENSGGNVNAATNYTVIYRVKID